MVVSPDGLNVYAVGNDCNFKCQVGTIVSWEREFEEATRCGTGGDDCYRLTNQGLLSTDDAWVNRILVGAANVVVAPDGKHVYVASYISLKPFSDDYDQGGVVQFERDTANGTPIFFPYSHQDLSLMFSFPRQAVC